LQPQGAPVGTVCPAKAGKDRQKMSVKVANSLFIVSSLKHVALYQQLFRNLSDFQTWGKRIIQGAEQAQMLRQTERMEECGLILSNSPIKEHSLIGQYYLGWSAHLKGQEAKRTFENVLESSKTYKPRALIALAAVESSQGNYSQELRCFNETLRLTDNPSIALDTYRGIAIMKAREGFHKQSLADLERLLPLAKYASHKIYYTYLNSYAVELMEIGRIDEATNISKIVLASPYAFAYPEWRETGADIARRGYKSRSSVPVIQSFLEPEKIQNVLYMPEPCPALDSPIKQKRGRLFSLEKWKEEKMVKSNGDEELDNLTDKDLVIKILHMSSEEGMTYKKLRKIIDYIAKVQSEPDE
jgi:tetratricopeptide (TPR) repeat protein